MSDWQTDSTTPTNSYAPDRFYTGSTNKKGFGQVVRIQIPPTITNEISALIASRAIPEYRTAQDFYRDAMIHRLHWIMQNVGNLANRKEVSETIHRLQDQAEIDMMLAKGAAERKLLADIKELVETGSKEMQEQVAILAEQALENGYSESTKLELQKFVTRPVYRGRE